MQQKNWAPFLFLVGYQIFTLVSLPFYFVWGSPTWGMALWMVALYYIGGFAITAGYHRLFSHRSYKASPLLEAVVLFWGSTTFQGSALRWCYDHRLHHAHIDGEKDPYSIQKGFFYAHMLWLFETPKAIDPKVVPDLMKKRLVVWQDRYDTFAMFGSNALVWLFCGWVMNDYLGAFFLATCARLLLLHHCTWFINSLAHTWGEQPFSKEHSAVNNYLISLLTFGEGYHNFHHTYANDYRNGVHWYQYDPTKWLIWILSKCRLAWSLKRADEFSIRKKILQQSLEELRSRTEKIWYVRSEALQERLGEFASRLEEKMAAMHELSRRLKAQGSEERARLKADLKELRRSFKREWRDYTKFWRSLEKLPC